MCRLHKGSEAETMHILDFRTVYTSSFTSFINDGNDVQEPKIEMLRK